MTETSPRREDNPDVRHEYSDVNVRAIFVFGVSLIAVALVTYVVLWLLFGYFNARAASADRPPPPLARRERREPPDPRLQLTPRLDLQQVLESQDQILNSYGWMDPSAGVVRIPIDRAMQLLIERGMPAVPVQPSRDLSKLPGSVPGSAGSQPTAAPKPSVQGERR